MFLSHSSWLCIILPTLIVATPQRTAPAQPTRSLPPKIQQVPTCAQPCLRKSLSEQFPFACTTPPDLNCLCSRYSFDGQTLGEVALRCIYASCLTHQGAFSAYNICLGESYAVAPTLTALTVAVRTSSTSASMTSSRPVTITTSHVISTTSTTHRPQSSHTETVVVDSVSLVPAPTSTTRQETTTSLAAGGSPKTMSPAQIAGLSVAVGAAFVIAIGIMGLTIFLRRRREQKNQTAVNEKGGYSPAPSNWSSHYSGAFSPGPSTPDPSGRFLLPPPPTHIRPSQSSKNQHGEDGRLKPMRLSTIRHVNASSERIKATSNTNLDSVPRPGQTTPNNASSSSVPLEQIGLAITVEPPPPSTNQNEQNILPVEEAKPERPTIARRNADMVANKVSQRPDSVMTQSTLFEEDDFRRESKLLPTLPPVPIPPIRTFQPSRPVPATSPIQAAVENTTTRRVPQQSELFLDIPVRYSKSQSSMVDGAEALSRGKQASTSASKAQLPPHGRTSEYDTKSAGAQSTDIPDYYFTAHSSPKAIHSVSSNATPKSLRSRPSQGHSTTKPKRTSSTISRATSRASTNIRDSFSSQTSFETVSPDDPTPEDDEADKHLQPGNLSPVAESPIHKLRYPKVPRTSNQLVPRSPQSQASTSSPRWQSQSQPSSLLLKRKGEQGALRLGSPFRTGSPSPDPRTTREIRRYRQHLRSSSVEPLTPATATWHSERSPRSARTQSSLWPKSPAMFDEPSPVRPLTIRKTQLLQTPTQDGMGMEALKSPVWVPRLTPTRKGDDLFIDVQYTKPGR